MSVTYSGLSGLRTSWLSELSSKELPRQRNALGGTTKTTLRQRLWLSDYPKVAFRTAWFAMTSLGPGEKARSIR
jgi:hypothetical protein